LNRSNDYHRFATFIKKRRPSVIHPTVVIKGFLMVNLKYGMTLIPKKEIEGIFLILFILTEESKTEVSKDLKKITLI